MSRIKISPDLFLEVCELNKLQSFMKEDGYLKIIGAMVKSFGVVRGVQNTYLKASKKSGSLNSITFNPGIAVNSKLNVISLSDSFDVAIPEDGFKHWFAAQYKTTNLEVGSVSVTMNGSLTGVGTKFTEVLRGGDNFPNKVRLSSSLNVNDYEVLKVISDTSAILSGSFAPEGNLGYYAVGTFTPGVQPINDNELIYEYDSCDIIELISGVEPILSEDQYFLAKTEYQNGVLSVSDLRSLAIFDRYAVPNSNVVNPIVSLLSVNLYPEHQLSVSIEHGYKISSFSFFPLSTNNTFRITGGCNFLGTGNIPDNLFKGWTLLNRSNMKRAVITSNLNKDLSIPDMDDSFIADLENDFVIIPNFNEIEVEVSVSDQPCPMYFKMNIDNIYNRLSIPVNYGDSSISLRYRLIGDYKTILQKFCISNFKNLIGDAEILSDSSFDITVNKIITTRQYS